MNAKLLKSLKSSKRCVMLVLCVVLTLTACGGAGAGSSTGAGNGAVDGAQGAAGGTGNAGAGDAAGGTGTAGAGDVTGGTGTTGAGDVTGGTGDAADSEGSGSKGGAGNPANSAGTADGAETGSKAAANGKTVLTLGILDPEWSAMKPQIVEIVKNFNEENEDIAVEFVTYTDEDGDYDAAVERLAMDAVAGDAPDIIEACFDYEPFAARGIFVDLYTLMEDEFREQLLESVLKAGETNGKLFTLAPVFYLKTAWGDGDLTEGRSGLSLMEVLELLKKQGKDLNAIYGFTWPPLTELLASAMDEFVDWSNASCNFTCDEFREFLTFARDYKGGFYPGGYNAVNEIEAVHDGEIVMKYGLIQQVSDYQIEKEIYGENINFIGLPTREGSGTLAYFLDELAISAASKNKDAAWEFLKYYILHYDCRATGIAFPLPVEQFEEVLAEAMQEDMSGGERVARGYLNLIGSDPIIVFAASREDVDAVRKLVESVDGKWQLHAQIQAIIEEEASYFLKGEKNLEDVVEIIQNRVNLYLQERS